MTAEKACLELLTFSECQSTALDEFFLAGFWILVLAAAFTTATFFKCRWLKKGGRRVVRWLAVIFGSLATMLFLSLTILCWTIHRMVASVTEAEGANENARAVYSCFTAIAFLSVVSWGITRQHKRDKTCDKCYGIVRNSSQSSRKSPDSSVRPTVFLDVRDWEEYKRLPSVYHHKRPPEENHPYHDPGRSMDVPPRDLRRQPPLSSVPQGKEDEM
jgi:uncharacterized membrane protein